MNHRAPGGVRWILTLLLLGSLGMLYLEAHFEALPYESCENPVWSPDGSHLAWQRLLLKDGGAGLALQAREVWMMDAAGRHPQCIGSFGVLHAGLLLSPAQGGDAARRPGVEAWARGCRT